MSVVIAATLITLAVFPSDLGDLTRSLITDAFVQVSVFVAATLLLFYGAERVFRFDIGQSLKNARGFQVPLAALLGATPGCGPQVLVATLFINGVIPFSALIGNAISNDGDALFPAIALEPRAAFFATAYSAVPALIVACGFYFLAPGFMN